MKISVILNFLQRVTVSFNSHSDIPWVRWLKIVMIDRLLLEITKNNNTKFRLILESSRHGLVVNKLD